MKDPRKIIIYISAALLLILFVFFVVSGVDKENSGGVKEEGLTKVGSFSHVHGLATDPKDPSKLYIATHEGLILLKDEKDLFRIGKTTDDLMGFQANVKDPNIFYSSGHPKSGGSLGFQKSDDGGKIWKKLSDGVNGPADFHALAVSSVNPDIIYGNYGGLQKSIDGGKNWELLNSSAGKIITLAADAKDVNTVYAGTVEGLKVSKDGGKNWSSISLDGEVVTMVVVNPEDSSEMFASTQAGKFIKSSDGGSSWKKVELESGGVLYLTYNLQDTRIIYAATRNNKIYKSTDGGSSWNKSF